MRSLYCHVLAALYDPICVLRAVCCVARGTWYVVLYAFSVVISVVFLLRSAFYLVCSLVVYSDFCCLLSAMLSVMCDV